MTLQLQQEIAVVTVVEGEGAIGSTGYEHCREQARLLICRHHEVGFDAVELSTEIVVARIRIVGRELFETNALEGRDKHGVGSFQRHSHHIDTTLVEITFVDDIVGRCVLGVHSE